MFFYPLTILKTKILKKWKDVYRHYRFTYVYHKWQSQHAWLLRYGAQWRTDFLSFWTIFCPFTPRTTWNIKILRKWKKQLAISSFYTGSPKIMTMCYTVPEIWCMTNEGNFYFSFWAIFCSFTPLTTQKIKILKIWKKKTPQDIMIFHMCTKKYDHMMYSS